MHHTSLITFLVILMPFLGHIYSINLPILYGGEIWISSLLVSIVAILKATRYKEFTFNYLFLLFIPYCLVLIIFDNLNYVSYFFLVIIFSFSYSLFFSRKRIYEYFVIFIAVHFLISFLLFYLFPFNFENWLIEADDSFVKLHPILYEMQINLSSLTYYPEKIKATFMDRTPTSLIFYLFSFLPFGSP